MLFHNSLTLYLSIPVVQLAWVGESTISSANDVVVEAVFFVRMRLDGFIDSAIGTEWKMMGRSKISLGSKSWP